MRRLESTRYTVIFATIVCVVCALFVSVAAVSLQPRQAANARLYMEKNILVAAGLVGPGRTSPFSNSTSRARVSRRAWSTSRRANWSRKSR